MKLVKNTLYLGIFDDLEVRPGQRIRPFFNILHKCMKNAKIGNMYGICLGPKVAKNAKFNEKHHILPKIPPVQAVPIDQL